LSEHFLNLSSNEQKEILETLATRLGRKSNVLEKDIWVCWALDVLFSIPNALPMAFKGGTSLSKVFGAIDRFSEDIDITIDYQKLAEYSADEFDPFSAGATKSAIKKFGGRLQKGVIRYASELIAPEFEKAVDCFQGTSNLKVEFSGKNEEIWIFYDSVVEQKDEYLREGVKIELGGRNKIDPSAVHLIFPDVAKELKKTSLIFPCAKPVVLAAERTFWEKATLIHAECNRNGMKANADRLSRHWHDLYFLNKSDIGLSALQDINLLNDVLKIKECFFRSGFSNYGACSSGKFRLIPSGDAIGELEKDYRGMKGMIYGETASFDQILSSLSELEVKINELTTA
jgi:hypothetical protein